MTSSLLQNPPIAVDVNRLPGPVVGVFDSGVGGLSVLPALRSALSGSRLLYAGDSAHAPYGERDEVWLQARCAHMARTLRGHGAQLLVVACNSATAAAVPALRATFPDWPIVGIEPGIKPAVQRSAKGRVGVMATSATLRSHRYERLLAEHGQGAEVIAQACTGLAMAIERGAEQEIADLVARHTEPLLKAEVDVVVLGCTHYPFARHWIERAMGPGVDIIDTSEAVARHAATVAATVPGAAASHPTLPPASGGLGIDFWTSGHPADLQSFARRWLGWAVNPRQLGDPAVEPGAAAAGP